jgi:ATP-dependent DNA helicase RecG
MDAHTARQTLNRLLAQPREGGTVEFKRSWDLPSDIGEYISALANSAALAGHDRAWMVWGVEDATREVVGTDFDPSRKKGEGNQPLITWLQQNTQPRADFEFHTCGHDRVPVVLLEIHPARAAPVAFKGERYIRIDSHKSKLSQYPDKEKRLWDALGGKGDWSGECVPEATMADLDDEALVQARRRFTEYLLKGEPDTGRHEVIRREASSWDRMTLLNKASLTKGGKITRSALLLLGKEESAHFLSPADVKMSWILRDEVGVTLDSQHFGPPFLVSTERLFSRVRNMSIEHLPDGTLFPTALPQYDSWVIREALHNAIAHQDYRLGGKINVVEHPDRLVFSNLGQFIPPSVEWMLEHQSPPETYRNPWLVQGMIRLRMIDQVGSGIRRMYESQRTRFFPLPDYSIGSSGFEFPRVELTVMGRILDPRYTQALIRLRNLELRQVILLDRIQKRRTIQPHELAELRGMGLVEGRATRLHISAGIAALTDQRAEYIRKRGFDDSYYLDLVLEFLRKYHQAVRRDLDDLLLPKLPEVLSPKQKAGKIRNLMQTLRRMGAVIPQGPRSKTIWKLGPGASQILSKQEPERQKLDKDGAS